MLKIAVCIKQIPLIEDANFDPVTKTIRRDGTAVISAFDLRALSLAISFKKTHSADVTVITMGPPQAKDALYDAYAAGADRAIHLEDRAFAGSDTLATARALAMWMRRESFDLILLGRHSLDAETGQVGPEAAEMLGIAQVSNARKVVIEGRTIKAERESDEGYDDIECEMPVLITCAERVAQPLRIRPDAQAAAKTKPIETVRAADLDSDLRKFGFAGSPTVVEEVRVQQTPKTNCQLIDAGDPVRAARELIAALDAIGALSENKKIRRPISTTLRAPIAGKDVWVACEMALNGEITRSSLELLSHGDELAARIGGALVAVGFPASFARHEALLASYGADQIIVIDSPGLESYAPEAATEAYAAIVRERKPWGVLIPASERGRDWGPRLAARLELGLTGDAIGIELGAKNEMIALKPAFGGNIVAPILSRTYPQLATIRAGMMPMAEPAKGRKAAIEIVRPEIHPAKSRLIEEHSLLDPSIAPLEEAEIVVGVGTGVGAAGLDRVKDLAHALEAGMCATRRVTDAGWMPRQLQVGLTGKAIEPRLYIAVGIRGVPNHTVGIKRAHTVVAINNDQESPIFERADFGLVGDWTVIVPALTDAFRERLGAAAMRAS